MAPGNFQADKETTKQNKKIKINKTTTTTKKKHPARKPEIMIHSQDVLKNKTYFLNLTGSFTHFHWYLCRSCVCQTVSLANSFSMLFTFGFTSIWMRQHYFSHFWTMEGWTIRGCMQLIPVYIRRGRERWSPGHADAPTESKNATNGKLVSKVTVLIKEMSRLMTKPTKWHVRPAKTQISLGIRPVWSESSLSAWRKLRSLATHWAHSEDSDQTGWMPRLIWVFAGRTGHFVGFVTRRFKCLGQLLWKMHFKATQIIWPTSSWLESLISCNFARI